MKEKIMLFFVAAQLTKIKFSKYRKPSLTFRHALNLRVAQCAAICAVSICTCARSQPLPEAQPITLPADAPLLKTEAVSTPVRAARAWSTALAPNARGGWNFITQLYQAGS